MVPPEFEMADELPPAVPRRRDDVREQCWANPGVWIKYPGVAHHSFWKAEGFEVSRRKETFWIRWPEEQT